MQMSKGVDNNTHALHPAPRLTTHSRALAKTRVSRSLCVCYKVNNYLLNHASNPPRISATPNAQVAFRAHERKTRVTERTRGSYKRFVRSQHSLAGGVSSAVRRNACPHPLFFTHGTGSRIFDVDGNSYLDYTLAWGPLILGQAPAPVIEAVQRQAARGFTFGAQHDLEIEVAEQLTNIIPCADLVCFANSGTEIVQIALRLARAATGRSKLLKFEGHYHGWDDSVLVSYHPTSPQLDGDGLAPVPVGAGQLPARHTVIAEWNNIDSVNAAFAAHPSEISAVICEPMMCNSGCIPPRPGFLEFLREVTTRNRAVLVFDEVITGFRLHLQGAQGHYGVVPDLATFAKAVGGGTAVSVLAGKAEYMEWIAKGGVVHAGTLNGNPLSLAAVKATLDVLSANRGTLYSQLWRLGERLRLGLQQILQSAGYSVVTSGAGPVFQLSFMGQAAWNYRETLKMNPALQSAFALALLDEGVLTLPDGRWYISAAHSDVDVDATLAAAARIAE
jgi:glutamate-1-semialdehyde 2,1-aminomutase